MVEFCKETDCLETLLFVSNFTCGLSSGKTHTADCCFVSGSYWYTQVSSPATMSQTRGDLPPSKFSLHVGSPIHPTPLLLDTHVMGHSTGTTFPYAKAVVKNASEGLPVDSRCRRVTLLRALHFRLLFQPSSGRIKQCFCVVVVCEG